MQVTGYFERRSRNHRKSNMTSSKQCKNFNSNTANIKQHLSPTRTLTPSPLQSDLILSVKVDSKDEQRNNSPLF